MAILANLEYIVLRFIRKFFFTTNLLNYIGKYMPYYQVNKNQQFPNPIVSTYKNEIERIGLNVKNKIILEIGTGSTLSTGYELVHLTHCKYIANEPFVSFNNKLDNRLQLQLKQHYNINTIPEINSEKDLNRIESQSVDVVLSNSVLEHVTNMDNLLAQLKRILKPEGVMIHSVDYRDHFFKYPYHFLQFSEKTWNKWLNPGDLPRWRLTDHEQLFKKYGFEVFIVKKDILASDFEVIVPKISDCFAKNDPYLGVSYALIQVKNIDYGKTTN